MHFQSLIMWDGDGDDDENGGDDYNDDDGALEPGKSAHSDPLIGDEFDPSA